MIFLALSRVHTFGALAGLAFLVSTQSLVMLVSAVAPFFVRPLETGKAAA